MTGMYGEVRINGAVVAKCRNWSLSREADNQERVDSDNPGSTRREKGNTDWTVSMECYLDSTYVTDGIGDFPFDEGDDVSLDLYADNDTPGPHWHADSALVDSIENEVDIEGAGIIGATVNLSKNSEMTKVT